MVNKKYLYIGTGVLILVALVYALFSFVNNPSYDEDEKEVFYCTEEQKSVEACTMEYAPVCGFAQNETSQTYGNACVACMSGEVDYYAEGEC